MPLGGVDEVVLAIERVALTTNNISCAALGDSLRHWEFFPTETQGWGHLPAWGFAEVLVSDVSGVEVGERFYGYFPIATHVVMKPQGVTGRGFHDGRELSAAYNQYTRCSADPAYRRQDENLLMLLRPLLTTSRCLADSLPGNVLLGADDALRERVHRHFGSALGHDCCAGATHSSPPEVEGGPRLADALQAFIRHVGNAGWLHWAEHTGFEAARSLIKDLCSGRADPQLGHVVVL